ncbi:MAG: hypothetical protein Q4E03_05980 [Trueperella sp.]|nr:hypothetical protein [Trueperella sp.]
MRVRAGWAVLALVLATANLPSGITAAAVPAAVTPSVSAGLAVLNPDPEGTAQVDSVPSAPEVTDWFANRAAALMNSDGPKVFPKLDATKIREFTIGDPVRSVSFAAGAITEQNALVPGQRWVAPILDGTQVVGAVSANYVSGTITDEVVVADVRLGTEAAHDTGAVLIYDPVIKAWFALRDQAIEPADRAGSSIVLGAVPLRDFLLQRSRILTEEDEIAKVVAEDAGASTNTGTSLPILLIIFFSLVMLVTVSVVWLRWDYNAEHRKKADEQAPENKSEKSAGEQKPKYTELVEKVRIFERPQSATEVNDEVAEPPAPMSGGEEQ